MNTSRESISVRLRRSVASLGPFEYAATLVLVAVYVIGTSMDDGPGTSMDFYRAVATVIPTLLITVAIQGRIFELSRKLTFRHQYRTVLFTVVVFGGEAGTLMTGREAGDQLGRTPLRLHGDTRPRPRHALPRAHRHPRGKRARPKRREHQPRQPGSLAVG